MAVIPRILHHIWIGGPLPSDLAVFREGWVRNHPDWEHRLWTGFDWLTNQDLYDRAEEITPGSEGQFRADVARYEILHRFGGVYVDCDFESVRPIDPLCAVTRFAAWEDDRWVNNAILGCHPGDDMIATLIADLPGNVTAHKGRRPNVLSGPQFLTPRAKGLTVYPSAWFYPYRWDDLDGANRDHPDAYAIHHWANRRRRDRRPLPAPREVTRA